MAGIDKTYLNWEQYRELKKWCKGKSFTLSDGTTVHPSDFIWKRKEPKNPNPEITLPVWNTPVYMDIWLIRNCNLPFIVKPLKEQYGEDGFAEIAEHRSSYDTFQRNGLGRAIKFKVIKRPRFNARIKEPWLVQCSSTEWAYNEENDTWVHWREALPITSDTAYLKNFSLRKIHRKLKKWNLPSGLSFHIIGKYVGQEYEVITK